jgi:peptidoglycan/LPS O-acetylase OafA/YrhL
MVAVLTVFANHLWGWPRGGFVGVDVFFVISGFLITNNLLRGVEKTGTVSFKAFYWNRARRIVPAATAVLIVTCLASAIVFLPFRSHTINVDALFAFAFLSNWWFAYKGTDYFRAVAETVSPVQHYWSLSIEEQFYMVWPAIIFVVGILIVRKNCSPAHRRLLTGLAMATIVVGSLGWAVFKSLTSPTTAYFDTFSRVWELGIGALLAIFIGVFDRTPTAVKPIMSWLGLGLIAASLFSLSDSLTGFPAPWALLPVAGAVLVIAAGVGGEPDYLSFLRNPASTYVGDISYSLYLVHWPVIVILGAFIEPGVWFSLAAICLAFSLAVVSYHFVENPLRKGSWSKLRDASHDFRSGRYHRQPSTRYSVLGAAVLLTVALIAIMMQRQPATAVLDDASGPPSAFDTGEAPVATFGPATTALQKEIVDSVRATSWPALDPSMDSLLESGQLISPEVGKCAFSVVADPKSCNYGSQDAPVKVVLIGDSVGSGIAEIVRELAVASQGNLLVINETMAGCVFTQDTVNREEMLAECPGRKDSAVEVINAVKPDAVIVANAYEPGDSAVGDSKSMTPQQWADSLNRYIARFRTSTKSVVLVAPPPSNISIRECYSKRSSSPLTCVGKVSQVWKATSKAERTLQAVNGAVWVDSRPWFCSPSQMCPAFVGTTPARVDEIHMAPPYGIKILPAFAESLRAAGVALP